MLSEYDETKEFKCCEKDGCEDCYNCQCLYSSNKKDEKVCDNCEYICVCDDIPDEPETSYEDEDEEFCNTATSAETKVKFKKVLEQLKLGQQNIIEDTNDIFCSVQ